MFVSVLFVDVIPPAMWSVIELNIRSQGNFHVSRILETSKGSAYLGWASALNSNATHYASTRKNRPGLP